MPRETSPSNAAEQAFRIGEWLLEPALDKISRGIEVHRLEPRTTRLLVRLAENPGKVVSSQELLDSVWSGVVVGPASVYQAISQLRKLLGDSDPDPHYIVTVPRKGYRLIAPVSAHSPAEPPRAPAELKPPPMAYARNRRWMAMLGVLVLAGLIGFFFMSRDRASIASLNSPTIAVFPFAASPDNEASRALAPIVTDVLRLRLAALRDLSMIAATSTEYAIRSEGDPLSAARKLRAGYALRGDVARTGDEVRIDATLLDSSSGNIVWKHTFQRPMNALDLVSEEIAHQTARSLELFRKPEANQPANELPLDIDVYGLYLRGKRLMSTYRAGDAEQAADIFTRVTTLDPKFARGYLALGQALFLSADLGARPLTADLQADAGKAFDRALELNPSLGEAWAQRARLTQDPAEADAMYRRALELAPGFDESYVRYSDFLFTQRRRGEAMDLIERARRIDPLSATLRWRKSQLLIATMGDVAGQQRELREALIINPEYPTALRELAQSNWLLRGDFADAIRLVERSLAVDRDSERGDWIAVGLYLDLGDPEAAKSVLRNTRRPDTLVAQAWWIPIATFARDGKRMAALAHRFAEETLASQPTPEVVRNDQRTYSISTELYGWYNFQANGLRDDAIARGDFSYAVDRLGRIYEWRAGTSAIRIRGMGLAYADTLLLGGETRRARELINAMLRGMEAEQTGRPANWFAWERASAYAMLGEDERALAELAASLEVNHYAGWWYTAELDPVFARIRPDPRFQALAAKAREHRDGQRKLLEEMRLKGEVPRRG